MDLVSPSYNIIHIYIYIHTQLILIVWLCMSENRAPKKKTMDDQHRGSTADVGHQLHLGPWDPSRKRGPRAGVAGPFETEGCYPAKMGFTRDLTNTKQGLPGLPSANIYLIYSNMLHGWRKKKLRFMGTYGNTWNNNRTNSGLPRWYPNAPCSKLECLWISRCGFN